MRRGDEREIAREFDRKMERDRSRAVLVLSLLLTVYLVVSRTIFLASSVSKSVETGLEQYGVATVGRID